MAKPEEIVREMWGRYRCYEIAKRIGGARAPNRAEIITIAYRLGLDLDAEPARKFGGGRDCSVKGPPKPKGFTREQIAWAKANRDTDREAGLIMTMIENPVALVETY